MKSAARWMRTREQQLAKQGVAVSRNNHILAFGEVFETSLTFSDSINSFSILSRKVWSGAKTSPRGPLLGAKTGPPGPDIDAIFIGPAEYEVSSAQRKCHLAVKICQRNDMDACVESVSDGSEEGGDPIDKSTRCYPLGCMEGRK